MTRHMTKFLALLVAVSLAASGALAGTIKVVQVPNPGTGDLAGMITNDVLIDAGETEQIGAIQIYANLTEGSFYQNSSGGNSPPSSQFIGFVPPLAFDTFAASGAPINDQFTPLIVGASVDLGSPNTGGGAVLNANTFDVTFAPQAGQNTLGALDFLAARMTIGSEGFFRMFVEFSGGGSASVMDGTILDGILSLGGDILLPGIDVSGNTMSIVDGDVTPSEDDHTDFGNALLGSMENRSFTISNTGDANLDLSALNITGGFSLVGTFPGTIGPAGSAVFQVGMDTSTLGAKTGTVSFGTNVEGVALFNFDLAGNVIPEPASMTLFGLALIGLVGLGRRRS